MPCLPCPRQQQICVWEKGGPAQSRREKCSGRFQAGVPYCTWYRVDARHAQTHSCRMASSALMRVARRAGRMPESSPTRVEKPSPSRMSQNGITEMALDAPSP